MVSFDRVLGEFVQVCENFPDFDKLSSACIVRDLQGCVRLVLDPLPSQPALDRGELARQLEQRLGRFFVGPIWSSADTNSDQARLARGVLREGTAWTTTYDDPITGSRQALSLWKKIERRLSKQTWLDPGTTRDAPWPLRTGTPPIVTFYSFKGGVGRTTALFACAWQLARDNKRVVLIDLDLEAPGLGPLLGIQTPRGVADFLVDHVATGASTLESMVGKTSGLGEAAENIFILSAGNLDLTYLEKLARIDFLAGGGVGSAADSPVEQAMEALLKFVRSKLNPHYIFIDSRAGLHDIAGLSLHRLAHVDVLVGRASEQGYRGMDIAVHALCCRKEAAKLQCVLVHSMAPAAGMPAAEAEEREFRVRSHAVFSQHVYGHLGRGTFDVDTHDAPHRPVVVRESENLRRFANVATITRDLEAGDYTALLDAILTRCAVEIEDDS